MPSHKYQGMSLSESSFSAESILFYYPDHLYSCSTGIYSKTRYSRRLFFVSISVYSILSSTVYTIWCVPITSGLFSDWDYCTTQVWLLSLPLSPIFDYFEMLIAHFFLTHTANADIGIYLDVILRPQDLFVLLIRSMRKNSSDLLTLF